MTNPSVADLLTRSNRAGTDPNSVNCACDSTSAKGTGLDPVTGQSVDLVWVKGAGSDLGTLTVGDLAVLRLDRLRMLVDVYKGGEHEHDMAAALYYCLHGSGGAAPSIDTAMHGLVAAAHVDHFHPESCLSIATALDGETLTSTVFGDKVAWIPWTRPGFRLGLDIFETKNRNPAAVGCILSGHGITVWGNTSEEVESNSRWIIDTATAYISQNSRPEPFGPVLAAYAALPTPMRRAKAAALAPALRRFASQDRPMIGHYNDADVVLDFLAGAEHPRLAELGTSCPHHLIGTKAKPLVLDLPASATIEESIARLEELAAAYRDDYRAYYERHAVPGSQAIRGTDPRIFAIPGVGVFSYGPDKQSARTAGDAFVHTVNVMRGAEGLSHYTPIAEAERFHIEYSELKDDQDQRKAEHGPLSARIAFVTGGASGIGKATAKRLAAEGACVVIVDLSLAKAQESATDIGGTDIAIGVAADVSDEAAVQAAVDTAVLAFGGLDLVVNNAGLSLSKPLLETTAADWDLQHDVMAKGCFLVAKAAANVLVQQDMGGDIVYIASKNSVFAGPDNIAYSAAKADQAHQVRLLATELGQHGVKVNGVNPDGVVRGSGIFAGTWGARRAAVYGVPEHELGHYYAQRTLLKREVLPEHVANAVFVLVGPELTHTTGLHVPVDSGVPAAFLR